jgi:dsRNA-specific ribonuclease
LRHGYEGVAGRYLSQVDAGSACGESILASEREPCRPPTDAVLAQAVRALLLGDTSLASIAKHYKLGTKVPAATTGETQSRQGDHTPGHQAALLRTYLAALHAQEGERFAYQWIRQNFRSVLNNSYDELRAQQKEEARAAREKEILSPMSHLRNFVRHRPGVAPEWNIAVRGDREEYRAEVALFGLRTSGTANTIRMAKQNAAEKLMHLVWVRRRLPASALLPHLRRLTPPDPCSALSGRPDRKTSNPTCPTTPSSSSSGPASRRSKSPNSIVKSRKRPLYGARSTCRGNSLSSAGCRNGRLGFCELRARFLVPRSQPPQPD